MRIKTSALAIAALFLGCLALVACDQDEQGRIRNYEQGTYLGEPDTPLTEEQRDLLRQRAREQSGS